MNTPYYTLLPHNMDDDQEDQHAASAAATTGVQLETLQFMQTDHHHPHPDHTKKRRATGTSSSSKRGGGGAGAPPPNCQAERCYADLTEAKKYHQRHRVCEFHAKAPAALVFGLNQRFCQQCSRFHELSEFDDSKRSCRRRLAGHNQRRRKSSSGDPNGESPPPSSSPSSRKPGALRLSTSTSSGTRHQEEPMHAYYH